MLGTSSPPALEKLLRGAPPTKTIQEAMKTHEPFGSHVFVSAQPVYGALELMSTEIQTSSVTSHVEEGASPPCTRLRRVLDCPQMEPMPSIQLHMHTI